MTSPVTLSVVIVNYNVKDLLVSCLASLQASLRNLPAGSRSEIIVVDNNSTDGSIEYAEPLFPTVQFVRCGENLGFGKANNVGFEMALRHGAEFVLCLNPDTLIGEDTMAVVLAYMRSKPEVGLAGCKLLNADGTFQLACRRGFPTPWASFCKVFGLQALFPNSPRFAQYNQTFRSENETYAVDAVMGAFMFIRREALEAIGGGGGGSKQNGKQPREFFDEAFFMYGEDLDLCYRIQQAGWRIMYLHTTSIIHYKGESTRRSSINEVKHFYEAMEIFAAKHYGSSWLFLAFLRIGIAIRSVLAYASLYRLEVGFALADVCLLNAAMLVASYVWKGRVWVFPSYAYPTVFVVLSLITLAMMTAAGEYSPYSKPSVRRTFSGMMMSFFVLSALTYFFRDYAFSRTVLLLTIGLGICLTAAARVGVELATKLSGGGAERRIAFIGDNPMTARIIAQLDAATAAAIGKRSRADVVGIISTASGDGSFAEHQAVETMRQSSIEDMRRIGDISYLPKIIEQYGIQEVIVTDTSMERAEIVRHIIQAAQPGSGSPKTASRPLHRATFRFAQEYDEVIAARIVERYTASAQAFGQSATQPVAQYRLLEWKYRLLKRTFDIVGSLFCVSFLLTIAAPVVSLQQLLTGKRGQRKPANRIIPLVRALLRVLRGHISFIGLYALPLHDKQTADNDGENGDGEGIHEDSSLPGASTMPLKSHSKNYPKHYLKNQLFTPGKIGMTGLAHVHAPETLSVHALHSLNEFYARQYSLWLDIDILLTLFFRRKRPSM
jgi:GT2 family glycosyltransferase